MTASDDEVAAALADLARISGEAAGLAEQTGRGTALVPAAGTDVPAEQVKDMMVTVRHDVTSKKRALLGAQRRAREAIEAKKRALDDELARMSAVLAPLKEQADRLQEGIWSINLYLGVGEGIVMLTDGPPAPAGTPIHVRQTVLAMDEESAVAAEGGGLDHMGIGDFDAWITADPAHVEQLIPEPRGVVAIMPRRADKDYGTAADTMIHNELNHQTYLLIRNGGCLYRYIADGFSAGRRLTPLRDEFTSLFTSREYDFATGEYRPVPLEPGTPAWERAERATGARERHYMRVALILQGLIDRTAVFHPLSAPNLSLLHPRAYDEGHVVLIADDELVLTTGRAPFRQWLADRNAQLRPGMRIVGNFRSEAWHQANNYRTGSGSRPRMDQHSRVWPRAASHPETGQIYTVERREGADLVFLYKRTDEVWRRNVPVPDRPGYVYTGLYPAVPAQRASARISPGDPFVIPLDLVTIAECEAYLRSRADRHAYAGMFPVLKAVIAAKRAEADAEAPMRQLLTGCIARDHGVSVEDAAAAVPALVDWWKLANRWHRPLVTGGDPKAEARAISAITAEFAARRAAAAVADDEPELAGRLREVVRAAMLVARKRDGTWVVLEPQPRTIDGETGIVFAREHTWSKTLAGHRVRDWLRPEPSQVARWRVLWSSPAWAGWDTAAAAADHLTDPEISGIITTALQVAGQRAAAPCALYRNSDPEPPLGGCPVAVHHQRSAGRAGSRFTVYWLCGRRGGRLADGADGAELAVTWRRTTGGRVAASHGSLRPHRWTSLPWPHAARLAWTDNVALAELEQALQACRVAQDARRALRDRADALRRAIGEQWTEGARETARIKFIADYGDESLWPDHAAGLRFDCPHTRPYGWELAWEKAVEGLVAAGADLAGLTVAEMAAVHADRFGAAIEVPEDIAGYRFPGDQPRPSDPQASGS